MIVVFVIDTSPSMGLPVSPSKENKKQQKQQKQSQNQNQKPKSLAMSRLDLAKMVVESVSKGLDKRLQEHNRQLQHLQQMLESTLDQHQHQHQHQQQQQKSAVVIPRVPPDQFLLLSTGRQDRTQPGTAACGAGGRLLVGYGDSFVHSYVPQQQSLDGTDPQQQQQQQQQHSHNHGGFERELKRLKASTWSPSSSSDSENTTTNNNHNNNNNTPFPEDAGGANGLNAALSCGFQLLHRYRLRFRSTENFGLGRLLHIGSTASATGGATTTGVSHALQPACLILLTDGECLTRPPELGGGSLQLQFGNMPLREFYREPFRWDQRLFCIRVGMASSSSSGTASGASGDSSSNAKAPLASSLRALCEVTGGGSFHLRTVANLSSVADSLLRKMAPPKPKVLPLPDPLRIPSLPPPPPPIKNTLAGGGTGVFLNGGPVCTFQTLERGLNGEPGPFFRAMLQHVPYQSYFQPHYNPLLPDSLTMDPSNQNRVLLPPNHLTPPPPPVWCIPESYWPNKKLDTLPPRLAQPILHYSKHYQVMSNVFDPLVVMKALHRLDQLISTLRQPLNAATLAATTTGDGSGKSAATAPTTNVPVKLLQRDVYVCEWLEKDNNNNNNSNNTSTPSPTSMSPPSQRNMEHYPLCVRGASRPSLIEGEESVLNVGILHVPFSEGGKSSRSSTVTMLPPDPHILLPLLVRAAEAEYRTKKAAEAQQQQQQQGKDGAASSAPPPPSPTAAAANRKVFLDEAWRTEFRAYLYRIPPYYQGMLRRALRPILPPSAHGLLGSAAAAAGDSHAMELLASQCFARGCLNKIRMGEQMAKEMNERLERQEEEYRRRGVQPLPVVGQDGQIQQQQQQQQQQQLQKQQKESEGEQAPVLKYGQYDPRASVSSYLSALRLMPPPWRVSARGGANKGGDAAKQDKTGGDGGSSGGASSTAKKQESNMGGSTSKTKEDDSAEVGNNPVVTDVLGDLPSRCLLAYYESRRRWIFGGSGLTTKSLAVEGVYNDGSNTHHHGPTRQTSMQDQPLLSLAGVGASSCNQFTIHKMGDYRERLLWCRSPVVGYGSNDSSGSAATTMADGSTQWSVDDDAFPLQFFDARTGKFQDSIQTRVTHRLQVNFGNPFNDKRGTSIVPEKFQSQRPPSVAASSKSSNSASSSSLSSSLVDMDAEGGEDDAGPQTPPGSPPHDSFSEEGEGEAFFAGSSGPISHKRFAKKREASHIPFLKPRVKKQKGDSKSGSIAPGGLSRSGSNSGPKSGVSTTGLGSAAVDGSGKTEKAGGGASSSNDTVISTADGSSSGEASPSPSSTKTEGQGGAGGDTKKAATQPQQQQQQQKQQQQQQQQAQQQQQKQAPQQAQQQAQQQQQQQQAPVVMDMTNPNMKPKVNLPQGWMCVWSKSQRRWYFFDTRTNKSVWEWPPPGLNR